MSKIGKLRKVIWRRPKCVLQPKWTHRVFFPHVPKCAGTSVNSMIRGSFNDMHSQSIDLHKSKLAASSIGLDIMAQRKALVAYWMANDQPSLISGHCHCPPSLTKEFSSRWNFITVLREPTDRWISEFVFNTYKPLDDSWARNKLPLSKFLDTEKAIRMGQTLASYFGAPDADDNEKVLTAATNLKMFALVGFQTRLPEFQSKLSSMLNVALPFTESNRSPNSVEADKIRSDPGAMRAVRELCKLDLKLWSTLVHYFGSPDIQVSCEGLQHISDQ